MVKGITLSSVTRARRQVRLSRSLGLALTPKAVKHYEKRPYPPGEHGRNVRRKESDFAVRLREKQRLRAQYGIREKQMARIFDEARKVPGRTGEAFIELLEMRLDALVLRSGFARTIKASFIGTSSSTAISSTGRRSACSPVRPSR